MQTRSLILCGCALLVLSACSSLRVPSVQIPGVHRIDIQQGNVITQEMVSQLKPGMSKNQVRFVLGTPPIVDVFHQERWDYVYSLKKGGKAREQRHITLLFEGEALSRITGDVTAASALAGDAALQPGSSETAAVTVTPIKQKKGLFKRLRSAVGLGGDDTSASSKDIPTEKDEIQANPATADPRPALDPANPAASENQGISP